MPRYVWIIEKKEQKDADHKPATQQKRSKALPGSLAEGNIQVGEASAKLTEVSKYSAEEVRNIFSYLHEVEGEERSAVLKDAEQLGIKGIPAASKKPQPMSVKRFQNTRVLQNFFGKFFGIRVPSEREGNCSGVSQWGWTCSNTAPGVFCPNGVWGGLLLKK